MVGDPGYNGMGTVGAVTGKKQVSIPGRIRESAARAAVGLVRVAMNARSEVTAQEVEPQPEPFTWRRLLAELLRRVKAENIPFLAAGLAYYGILAIVPGLIAAVSVYGLVADPAGVTEFIEGLGDAVPAEVSAFLEGQITAILEVPASSLSLSLTLSTLAALWAASNGTRALINGVNLAYGIDETRGFLKLRVLSVVLTVGLIAFVGTVLTVVAVGHRWLGGTGWLRPLFEYGRWPLVLVVSTVVLAGFYRLAPARRQPDWSIASVGAVVAAMSWLVASFGLAFYVSRFGSFNETYGTLGAVVVVLLWLFVSAFIVLLGAVLDSALADLHKREASAG